MDDRYWQDHAWSERTAQRLLDTRLYPCYAYQGRFVRLGSDPHRCEGKIQMRLHADVLMQRDANSCIAVEEKIVRYPGYDYQHLVVETHAQWHPQDAEPCGDGWIRDTQAECLLWAFETRTGGLRLWLLDYPSFRAWFFDQWHSFARCEVRNGNGITVLRKVPLRAIPRSLARWRDRTIEGGG